MSHDLGEIFKLTQKVYRLEKGRIVGSGSPGQVFIDHDISGKFQFSGSILSIDPEDTVYIISILIEQNIVKVVATKSETAHLKVGDKVMVASKAFNPLIKKIG